MLWSKTIQWQEFPGESARHASPFRRQWINSWISSFGLYDLAHWKSRLYLTLTRALQIVSCLLHPSSSVAGFFRPVPWNAGSSWRTSTRRNLSSLGLKFTWQPLTPAWLAAVLTRQPCHAVSCRVSRFGSRSCDSSASSAFQMGGLGGELMELPKMAGTEESHLSHAQIQQQKQYCIMALIGVFVFLSTTVLWPWLLPLWHSGTLRWSLGMITKENFTASLQIRSAWHSSEKKQWKSKRWSVSRRGWNVSRKSTRWRCTKTSASRR